MSFRKNCILIGDYVYDLSMTKNLPIENQLSICIVSNDSYGHKHPYEDLYDILIQ